MKRILIGAAIASMLSTGALAADLAPRMYTKAPVAPPVVYDWTGFYIGGNVGYSWGRSSTTTSFSDATGGALLFSTPTSFDMDGVIGGAQLGYNWQLNNWVFGLEGDIQGSGQQGAGTGVCPGGSLAAPATLATLSSACAPGHLGDTAPFNVAAFPVTSTLTEKLRWFGTVRGRIGSTIISPTVLLYATGGLAYGGIGATDAVSGTNIVGPQGVNGSTLVPVSATLSNDTTRFGWTVGAGVEGAVSGNWTVKAEYLYLDLGNVSGSFVTPIVAPSGAFLATGYSSHITDNIFRVGFNYKFGGPVVAKY